MASKIRITDPKELEEFVRTHLGHRLTAMVSPICLPKNHPLWNCPCRRNDAYRAAKEGSYVMLRLFIEFLGVKGAEQATWKLKERTSLRNGEDIHPTDLVLSCFTNLNGAALKNLSGTDFGKDEALVAKLHRTLCKINAHFTYDTTKPKFFDRIDSPRDVDWERAVKIVVTKLDECFYQRVNQPIVLHYDLVGPFTERFTRLRSSIKGDGLGPT
ncbi:MAG: hypothetical protein HOP33_20320 [Verrucomicrobia bacterium]|nr:hypothetical protein [Verrucomicrobiota bacterium]